MKHKRELDLIVDALDKFAERYAQPWENPVTQGDILRWLEEKLGQTRSIRDILAKFPCFDRPKKNPPLLVQTALWKLQAEHEQLKQREREHQELNGSLRRELDRMEVKWKRLQEVNEKNSESLKGIEKGIQDFINSLRQGSSITAIRADLHYSYAFTFRPLIKRSPTSDKNRETYYGYRIKLERYSSDWFDPMPEEQAILKELIREFGLTGGWKVLDKNGDALQLVRIYDRFPWDDLKADMAKVEEEIAGLLYNFQKLSKYDSVVESLKPEKGEGQNGKADTEAEESDSNKAKADKRDTG